jgi:osmoprotectant transport system permease protein
MGARAEPAVMSDIADGFGWLTTATNWWGANGILRSLGEHLWYSAFATALAILIGLPIGLAIGHTGRGRFAAAALANGLRAVPTVGIVMLLFLANPLALYPILVALTVLAVPSVILATAAGIESVEPEVRDAARGIGLSPMQVLRRVEIPNALPLIFAGIRSAANQVLATATVAGFGFGLGGLGKFIYSGYHRQRLDIVYGATFLVVALVLLVELILVVLQRATVSPGVRAHVTRRALPVDATMPSTLLAVSTPGGELP